MEISAAPEMKAKVTVAVCDSCCTQTHCNCISATQPDQVSLWHFFFHLYKHTNISDQISVFIWLSKAQTRDGLNVKSHNVPICYTGPINKKSKHLLTHFCVCVIVRLFHRPVCLWHTDISCHRGRKLNNNWGFVWVRSVNMDMNLLVNTSTESWKPIFSRLYQWTQKDLLKSLIQSVQTLLTLKGHMYEKCARERYNSKVMVN